MTLPTLVIVESPGKIRKIQGFLGPGYKVVATRGHLLGLPAKGYGFDPEALDAAFEVDYETLASKAGDVRQLRQAARRAAGVVVATDAGASMTIDFHALEVLGVDWRTARQAVFFEITRDALRRVAEPQPLGRRSAQQARRLVGCGWATS